MKIELKSIGIAKNQENKHFGNWDKVVTDLVIDEEYAEGLDGLKDYSHIIVIYWMHETGICELRHIPQGKKGEVPEVGIFACRCTQRPNPIGVSTIEIVSIKDNVVKVRGLDVIDNTPILDIKPYTPQYDKVKDARVPDWTEKLDY